MIPRRGRPALAAGIVATLFLACSGETDLAHRHPQAGDTVSAAARALFTTTDSLSLEGVHGPAYELLRRQAEGLEGSQASLVEKAQTWLHLGNSEAELGDNVSAMAHLSRAIELARAAGPRHRALEARALNAWGRAAKNNGLYDEARSTHESAAAIARGLGDDGLFELAMAKAGVANVLRRIPAKLDSTELLLTETVRLLRRAEGDSGLTLARQRVNHALALLLLDRRDEAREEIELALPVLDLHLGPVHASRGFEASLTGWIAFRAGDLPAAQASFERALRIYGRLRAAAKEGNDRLRYRPKAADILAAVHLAAGRPEEAWLVLDAAQSHLMREAPDGGFPEARPIAEVQACLDPKTAIIGWLDVNLVMEEPLETWVYVLRDRGPVRWLRLEGSPAARESFDDLTHLLRDGASSPLRVEPDSALVAAEHGAWRGRFAAAEPALRGVEDLVAILSPWMARVPLDVFVDDRGRPLAERFAVSYIQSPSLYVDRTEGARLARRNARPTTAVFIDGTLQARAGRDQGRVGIPARFATHTRVPAGSAAEPRLHGRWSRDHGAGQPLPGLVQFDGHSLIDYRLPGGSALVLDADGRGMQAMSRPARPDDPYVDDGSDGLLTMTEIEKLDLPAELVVLASCQSAGRYDYGAFVGIGEAFLRAGSRSVMTSLWPVDERATVELLRRFYGHAYGEDGRPRRSFAHALREARLELRDFVAADGSRPFAHPAYWAPFVLVGDRGLETEAPTGTKSAFPPVERVR